jgi:hypothetical protein
LVNTLLGLILYWLATESFLIDLNLFSNIIFLTMLYHLFFVLDYLYKTIILIKKRIFQPLSNIYLKYIGKKIGQTYSNVLRKYVMVINESIYTLKKNIIANLNFFIKKITLIIIVEKVHIVRKSYTFKY